MLNTYNYLQLPPTYYSGRPLHYLNKNYMQKDEIHTVLNGATAFKLKKYRVYCTFYSNIAKSIHFLSK